MIEELLKPGKENKVSFEYLMQETGCRDARTLRKFIAQERARGAIILSCCEGGYYLPSNAKEVEKYIKTMEKEAKTILRSLKHCKKYLRTIDGQIEIDISAERGEN